ncbi:hypothetical protein HN51_001262 [Arachis hypogaea]|uniref:Probable purine permease n=1 Tax=Arachis hypogaea TaxID=3818 RepID=A0A445ES76_ARAHY|nr:probable purine permease 11 [Arachis hypogaea]QHO49331.1 putative purine permease [Arachis hypogaea]RYR78345.1 hypothetical protein Ahy_A01g003120 [Arachis hypogaea]
MLETFKWWIRIPIYVIFLIAGQAAATLLGRFYYYEGGNSKWMATLVQSSGFPLLIPLLFYFSPTKCDHNNGTNDNSTNNTITKKYPTKSKVSTLTLIYIGFGLIATGTNLLYSYGLFYLPVSTYSLLCATQLAFTALFSYSINSQKFTPPIFNSVILLTASAALLAINTDDVDWRHKPYDNYFIIGFFCTIFASAAFSFCLSMVQLSFEKQLIKGGTFYAVLEILFYQSFVATCACVVGVFASGEWTTLNNEMKNFKQGTFSYVMTLLWIAVSWQVTSVGMVGLVMEVSSLFANLIATLTLPVVPIFAVFIFHDKMDGDMIVSLLLAVWGFLSYIYQHYLDDRKAKVHNVEGVC